MKPWIDENLKAMRKLMGLAATALCIFLVVWVWIRVLNALIGACISYPQQTPFTEKYVLQSMEVVKAALWPAVVVVFLWIYREPLAKLINRIRGFGIGDNRIDLDDPEPEDASNPPESAIPSGTVLVAPEMSETVTRRALEQRSLLIESLIRLHGTHSFQWIRAKTGVTWTDDEFGEAVDMNPKLMKRRIAGNGPDGLRLPNGRPGVKLRPFPK